MTKVQVPLTNCDCWLDGSFINEADAGILFQQLLLDINWRQDQIKMFGRGVKIPRLQYFMGDNGIHYTYSGLSLEANEWHPCVAKIRDQIEDRTGMRFNAVLLNLYRNGKDSMGWHNDNEAELGEEPLIASVSLGAARRFLLRSSNAHKPTETHELILHSGSLLWMGAGVQKHWKHALPKTKACTTARINLTFRKIHT